MIAIEAKQVAAIASGHPTTVLRRGRVGMRGGVMFVDRGRGSADNMAIGTVESYSWDGKKILAAVLADAMVDITEVPQAEVRFRAARSDLKRLTKYLEDRGVPKRRH